MYLRTGSAVLAWAALAFVAAPAGAGGFYRQEQSARAVGRAYAGEAADTGAASLWWNPAAIGPAAREAYLGAAAVLPQSQIDDEGSTLTRFLPRGGPAFTTPIGGEPRAFDPVRDRVVPALALATPLGDRFALGFSVATPFGFETTYRRQAWTRFETLRSRLDTADLQITGAWRMNDDWTVAASADAQYADLDLSRFPANSSLLEGRARVSGDGWAAGWSAGVLGRVGDVDVGLSYRASVDHDFEGAFEFAGLPRELPLTFGRQRTEIAFSTPWIATAAVRWAASDKATLGLQVQRFGWSEFDGFTVDADITAPEGGGAYEDTTSVALGVDYALSPGVAARAGLQYDPTPVTAGADLIRAPDADRWTFGVGGAFASPGGLLVDVSAAYAVFDDFRITGASTSFAGTPIAAIRNLAGEAELSEAVFAVGARWPF